MEEEANYSFLEIALNNRKKHISLTTVITITIMIKIILHKHRQMIISKNRLKLDKKLITIGLKNLKDRDLQKRDT